MKIESKLKKINIVSPKSSLKTPKGGTGIVNKNDSYELCNQLIRIAESINKLIKVQEQINENLYEIRERMVK